MDLMMVYRAQGATDVYLVRDYLSQHGIASVLRGEALQGLAGGIPIPDTRAQLWVEPVHGERALELIKAYEAEPAADTPWNCPACGESNPVTFDLCWSCGHAGGG